MISAHFRVRAGLHHRGPAALSGPRSLSTSLLDPRERPRPRASGSCGDRHPRVWAGNPAPDTRALIV